MKKILWTLMIAAILFSYIPVHSMSDCEEGGAAETIKMNCGYSFHCPFTLKGNLPEHLPIPLSGQIDPTSLSPVIDTSIHPIYRPPERWSENI